VRWLVLVVRLPAEPSRHRVAVWRELRRVGALQIGQGVWVVPDVAVFANGVTRAIELARRCWTPRDAWRTTARDWSRNSPPTVPCPFGVAVQGSL
jgi:hypothetical protein